MTRTVEWAWLGRRAYREALALQEHVHAAVVAGHAPETLLLLEHAPVITLGRHADAAHVVTERDVLAERGVEVVATSRGGDVTYHGPGQLVGYPIFRLTAGIRHHVTAMADAVRVALGELGIAAVWQTGRPGLWVGEAKLCAFGVQVRRRVTTHGFALNASIDLSGFRDIVPCGLARAGVTSIAELTGRAPPLPLLAGRVAAAFARVFDVAVAEIPAACPRLQIAFPNR
jgi:lipoyl(octanoyl) transferase